MKKLNKFCFVLVFLACTGTLCSQTVTWQRQPSWDAVEMLGDDLLRVEVSGKWGVSRFDGTFILPCTYAIVTNMRENCFLVLDSNGKILFLGDEKGNVKSIMGEYFVDGSWPYFAEGLLAVKDSRGLWGYLDKTGELAIKNQFRNAYPFFYGRAAVCETGSKGWCHINIKGRPFSKGDTKYFSFVSSYTKIEGFPPMAFVLVKDKLSQGERIYLMDLEGVTQNNSILNGGAAFNELYNQKTFICGSGNVSVEIEVNDILQMTSLQIGNKRYVCNTVTIETLPFPTVTGINVDAKGRVKVGEIVVSPQFQKIIPLNQEIALVKKEGEWGMIRFDLDEPIARITCEVAHDLKVVHAIDLPFTLSNKAAKTRVYAVDSKGNKAFFDSNEKGCFSVPMKYLHDDEKLFLGLEKDGILFEPLEYAIKVRFGDGFEVSGPSKATVGKNGYASFSITIRNHTEYDAAPFDVYVDNNHVEHVEGLRHQESVTIPVTMKAKIGVLEDYVVKKVKVQIEEEGFPTRNHYPVSIKFERMYKKE